MSATYDSGFDIRVEDHGTICLLVALTNGAMTWLTDNTPDDVMKVGESRFVVEPRYVRAIVEGAIEEGLEVGS